MPAANSQIVWIDCEMTGLDVDTDALCEVAVIITDYDLQPVHSGFEVIINPGADALANMNDFVRKMHEKSGLLARISSGVSLQSAQNSLLAYLEKYLQDERPLVAGNTIGMDRRFISKYMPDFDAKLHYRSIDVSTIKELARHWFAEVFAASPPKGAQHRALSDIAESIRELDFYRRTILAPNQEFDSLKIKQSADLAISRFQNLIV